MNFIRLILLISMFLSSNGNSDWKLRKEKDEISVYTRSVEGSSLDEFKAVTTLLNTSIAEVLDIILDVKNYDQLFPDCFNSRVLEQKGKYYDIHYFAIKAPWPVKNRDAVYESITTITNNQKMARVELKPLGDYMEEKPNLIRLYKGSGFWKLEEIENGRIKVTYQFHGEPGGKIPAWLANSHVVSSPFLTLINLKTRIEKQKKK